MNAPIPNMAHWTERCDMAAAFRWTARLNMHESVANHFSLAVNPDGTRFLINPNGRHFARITASSLVEIDANDPATMDRPDAPDPTAWGLHGSIHRALPHARCVMHVHSIHATVLASLADSRLPAIDQNTAMFHRRIVVDDHYGGMALGEEAARCASLLADPAIIAMVMGWATPMSATSDAEPLLRTLTCGALNVVAPLPSCAAVDPPPPQADSHAAAPTARAIQTRFSGLVPRTNRPCFMVRLLPDE